MTVKPGAGRQIADRQPTQCTAEEAAALVTSGMSVAIAGFSAEPLSVTSALWRRADELEGVIILTGMLLSGYAFLSAGQGRAFRLRTWFRPGTLLGKDARSVNSQLLPLSWTQTVRFLAENPVDVALIQLSPPDAEGYHSLGISPGNGRALIQSARIVIAEVNERMPYTCGDSRVHASEIDYIVPTSHELPAFPHRQGDEIDRMVGTNAASLVHDGATLQFGIGAIPGAMLDALIDAGRRDLKIISQLSDAARRLIEAGCCVSGEPAALVSEIMGSRELYDWVDRNPLVEASGALATHSLRSLTRMKDLVCVNSALEVDLYGQVNSEMIDGVHSGGIGGSADFAAASINGEAVSIIALRSRTKDGRPRIIPQLKPGPVTLQRTLTHYVVTEYGTADLRYLTVGERTRALATIAHPDDREVLLLAAAEFE